MAKSLVIVESPAKAKTIGKYLGRNYVVKASLGHVKDLPKDALGIDMKVVSYDGTADRMKALLANTVHIGQVSEATGAKHAKTGRLKMIAINYHTRSKILPGDISEVKGQIAAGKVRALAVLSPERLPTDPNIPTAKEQGFDLEITSDRGIVLPKGASPQLVTYYADLLEKVSKDPKFIKGITDKGSFVSFVRGEAYVDWWKQTNAKWTTLAKKLGVYRQ